MAELAKEIIRHSFSDSKHCLDRSLPNDPRALIKLIREKLLAMSDTAESNMAQIQKIKVPDSEEILDGAICDLMSEQASEINNWGPDEQVRYMVVEAKMTVDQINNAIAEGEEITETA